jgi:hypothetical protein
MNDRFQVEGMAGYGGNCSDCGDDLCAECGGGWNEEGKCLECAKKQPTK